MKMIPREMFVPAISLSNVFNVHMGKYTSTVDNVNKKQGMKKVPSC